MLRNSLRGLDFGLGEVADALRDTVSAFTAGEIAPIADQIDRSDEFPRQLCGRRWGRWGCTASRWKRNRAAAGLGYLAHCVAMEEVSRGSGSIGLSYGAHSNLCVNQIRRNGNAEQKRRYLPKLISGEHVGALAMASRTPAPMSSPCGCAPRSAATATS